MVKKIVSVLLCAILGSTLYANDIGSNSRSFIGVEAGYAEVQGDRFFEPDFTGDYAAAFGFRVGAQNDEWRTTLIFNYYDSAQNDQNVEQGYLTLDYFLLKDERTFRPYIGANVGYANYESFQVDDSGFLYGVQAGVIVEAGENINLDLGYRYTLSDADALDHIGSIVFGINYMF